MDKMDKTSVYVFWSNHRGSFISICGNRKQAEREIVESLYRDDGAKIHGVVEGRQLTIHEKRVVKEVKLEVK